MAIEDMKQKMHFT